MFDPGMIMKLMQAKNQFSQAHPKFVRFLQLQMGKGLQEGSVLEITVTDPDGNPMTANMRVSAEDLQLFAALKELLSKQS